MPYGICIEEFCLWLALKVIKYLALQNYPAHNKSREIKSFLESCKIFGVVMRTNQKPSNFSFSTFDHASCIITSLQSVEKKILILKSQFDLKTFKSLVYLVH